MGAIETIMATHSPPLLEAVKREYCEEVRAAWRELRVLHKRDVTTVVPPFRSAGRTNLQVLQRFRCSSG